MTCVLDANVLLRIADPGAAQHLTAISAVNSLAKLGLTPRTIPQSIFEFWVVATRPIEKNGLGLSISDCEKTSVDMIATFPLINDHSSLVQEWLELVAAYQCQGKVAHDARYVAAMRTHKITHILTFNAVDFARYPDLTVLDPNSLAVLES
jgi:predicted nucleic acid-binding protein